MKKTMIFMAIALVLLGCEKNEPKETLQITTKNIVITHNGTEQLKVTGADAPVVYTVDNKYIASVSEDGVVKGGVKGKAIITATCGTQTATCDVEVKTLINFIPEPYIGFGDSYDKVKSELVKSGEVKELNGSIAQVKKISGDEFIYLYTFNSGKLEVSGFSILITADAVNVIVDYLTERYVVVSRVSTYEFALMSPDKKTAVALGLSSDKQRMNVIFTKFNN